MKLSPLRTRNGLVERVVEIDVEVARQPRIDRCDAQEQRVVEPDLGFAEAAAIAAFGVLVNDAPQSSPSAN